MENIFGVVIIYYPDDNLKNNISSYLKYIKKLLIVDNTPTPVNIPLSPVDEHKVIIFHDGDNRGIAERLNFAAQQAKNEGCKWMLTMDQDSSFTDFEKYYYNCFQQFPEKNTVAVFGVEYENQKLTAGCEYIEAKQLITSGSIVNLDILKQLNGFDENLFIDEVDFEYCYRSLMNGFRIIKFRNILLNHTIGKSREFASLKNLKRSERALHSPERIYYMIRNHLYVKKKYQRFFKDVFTKRNRDIITTVKNNILYNRKRLAVIKAICLGFMHYRKNITGKLKKYRYA